MVKQSYKEKLKEINTFVFDIDGVLTDGSVQVSTDGEMLRTMHTKDGYALKTAARQGFNICVISGGANEGVRKRIRDLGITDIYLGAGAKIEQMDKYFDIYDIKAENVLYMGDDIPDLPPMQMVGLPCCPQDAVKEIKEISHYISHKKGGKGCARDVIEQVLKVQGKWMQSFNT